MPSKPKSYKYNQLDFLINEASKKDKFIVVFPDTYIEKIFTDLYIENLSKNNSKCIKKSCTEISIDWVENNLLSYDMFSSDEQYLFFELDKLKKKQIDQLDSLELSRSDKNFIFVANTPIGKTLKNSKLFKESDIYEVMAPKFWEQDLYIEAYCHYLDLKLTRDTIQYINQSIENSSEKYFETLSLLKSFSMDGNPDINKVKEVLKPSHLDNFALADLFNQKNMKRLYRNLLVVENDFDIFRSFFSFIQGHIIKVIDPSYLNQKPKLSKYDQGIKAAHRKWDRDELVRELDLFNEYEILAKSKNIYLRDKLRLKYLEN